MKNLITSALMLLAVLLPATATADQAYDFEVDGIYYVITGDEVTVSYKEIGEDACSAIPYYYNDYSGNVDIPSTVTHDGITYPVTSIGAFAFQNCYGLTGVTIPNSVSVIGNCAFRYCYGLASLSMGNSVTSIGRAAFEECRGLTSVVIPGLVTSIGSNAFNGCINLANVTVGNSITDIGAEAFYDTPWLNNQPDGLVYVGPVAYCYNGTMPNGTNIVIKDGTLGIAGSAFFNCDGLASISIPNSVISICNQAFVGCDGLTSINIPNSVTSIGMQAFAWCSNLSSVAFGSSVTNISNDSFDGCQSLETITMDSGNMKYDSRDNCNALIETESNTLLLGCKSSTIPGTVTCIGDYAFSSCSGLNSITIPNSVTRIGYDAFAWCYNLTHIDIPNSVTSIGSSAFYR